MKRTVKAVGKFVLLVIVSFISIKLFFPYYRVATDSMTPTIPKNSIIIVNRYAYLFSSPKRGDVVLLNPQEGIFTKGVWAHRIIAIPGDSVSIKNNSVFINNETPQFSVLKKTIVREETIIPVDSYFQKGDSENSIYGLVKKDSIRGKVVFIF